MIDYNNNIRGVVNSYFIMVLFWIYLDGYIVRYYGNRLLFNIGIIFFNFNNF